MTAGVGGAGGSNASGGAGGQPKFLAVQPGDLARLRKPHACGGRDWKITRIGADIGLECQTCAHRVLLTRDDFERRCVKHTPTAVAEASDD